MLIAETIRDALIEIGVINPIDEASPEESEHALRTLNRIVEEYNQQGLLIPYNTEITISEPTGGWTRAIVMGHGQQIDIAPPIFVNFAFFRDGETDIPMKEAALQDIQSVPDKTVSGYPKNYFYQKDNSNNVQMIFNIIPKSGLELHLFAKMPYTGTAANGYKYMPGDDIDWEYGFEKLLMTRLAFELCASYGIPPSASLVAKLQETENVLKAANYKPRTLKSSYGRSRLWAIPSKYLSR